MASVQIIDSTLPKLLGAMGRDTDSELSDSGGYSNEENLGRDEDNIGSAVEEESEKLNQNSLSQTELADADRDGGSTQVGSDNDASPAGREEETDSDVEMAPHNSVENDLGSACAPEAQRPEASKAVEFYIGDGHAEQFYIGEIATSRERSRGNSHGSCESNKGMDLKVLGRLVRPSATQTPIHADVSGPKFGFDLLTSTPGREESRKGTSRNKRRRNKHQNNLSRTIEPCMSPIENHENMQTVSDGRMNATPQTDVEPALESARAAVKAAITAHTPGNENLAAMLSANGWAVNQFLSTPDLIALQKAFEASKAKNSITPRRILVLAVPPVAVVFAVVVFVRFMGSAESQITVNFLKVAFFLLLGIAGPHVWPHVEKSHVKKRLDDGVNDAKQHIQSKFYRVLRSPWFLLSVLWATCAVVVVSLLAAQQGGTEMAEWSSSAQNWLCKRHGSRVNFLGEAIQAGIQPWVGVLPIDLTICPEEEEDPWEPFVDISQRLDNVTESLASSVEELKKTTDASFRPMLESMENSIQNMEMMKGQLQQALQDSQEECETAKLEKTNTITDLQARLDGSRQRLEQALSTADKSPALLADVREMFEPLNQKMADLESAQVEKQSLQKRLIASEERKDQLQRHLDAASKENQNVNWLKQKIAELEVEKTKQSQKIADLKTKLQTQSKDKKQKIADLKVEKAKLQTHSEEQRQKITDLRGEKAKLQTQSEEQSQKIADLKEEIAKLQTQLRERKEDEEKFQGQVAVVENQKVTEIWKLIEQDRAKWNFELNLLKFGGSQGEGNSWLNLR